MDTETTEGVLDTTNQEGEGELGNDIIQLPKSEYDKLNQTLGSLKREIKDLKKPKEEPKQETPANQTNPDVNILMQKLEKTALRQAGIDHPDDIELARNTAKKWNMDIEDVLADEDFKVKLGRQQDSRSIVNATSNIRGGNGQAQAKNSPEYWISKGVPPTPSDVPDRAARAKIVKAFMNNAKSSKVFYND